MNKIDNISLSLKDKDKKVTVFGFVSNKRKMGELTFVDLRDRTGIVQVVIRNLKDSFSKESVLKISGTVKERKDKNKKLKTGDIEIIADEIKVLSNSSELPFVVRDDLSAKEDTKLQHRYLDLRRPKMQKIFKTRHIVVKAFRDFLDKEEFLEIETPMLSKSTPEGARDFLVPTRKEGSFFALPQSPQLYKQLLMASGFERYFQVAKVFRDEDSRKDRQPEFTQLDIELSYTDEEEVKKLVEEMMKFTFKKIGVDIKIPFKRMDYDVALNDYGTDKPDLRYKFLLENVKEIFSKTTFNVFKNASSVKAIPFNKELSNKEIKILEEVAKKNGAKGLAYVSKNGKELSGPGEKFFKNESSKLFEKFKINKGTILFVADEDNIVNQSLGAVRVKLNEMFDLASNNYEFVWIENWPLFEEEDGKFIAAHHPFTSPTEDTINTFDTSKKEARARSYDLALNGYEIGGGSIRINDLSVQTKMFEALGLSKDSYESQFGFFLEAFKYGLPPHGGVAFGIDRIIMIIENTESIRDVIAFPKNANGVSVLEKAPSKISNEQLKEYFIKLDK